MNKNQLKSIIEKQDRIENELKSLLEQNKESSADDKGE